LSVTPSPSGEPSAAAQLFVARVGTSGIILHADDVQAIVERLDGVPLAIEFAAARARTLGASELRKLLSRDLASLVRPTDSGARHPSLEVALTQSWVDLESDHQKAIVCLGVLGASFDYALAASILEPDHVALDVLEALVARGMLQFDGLRYRLLTPVADFVRRRQLPANDAPWDRLEEYLANLPLGALWARRWSDRRSLHAVAHLLVPAWVRAWRHGRPERARLILQRAYAVGQQLSQGEHERALADAVIESGNTRERAALTLERATLHTRDLVAHLSQAIALAGAAGDAPTEAFARSYRGMWTRYSDKADAAATCPEESMPLELRTRMVMRRFYLGVEQGLGLAADRLAEVEALFTFANETLDADLEIVAELRAAYALALAHAGQYDRAANVIALMTGPGSRSLDLAARLTGASSHIQVLCTAGKLTRADELNTELLHLARHAGCPAFVARLTRSHARVRGEHGDGYVALMLAGLAVEGFEALGIASELAVALRERARLELYFRRPDLARRTLVRAQSHAGAHHSFWVNLQMLECDMHEAPDKVAEARVLELVERSQPREAWAIATAQAMRALWLAHRGDRAGAGVAILQARRSLGPARGLQLEEIERVAKEVTSLVGAARDLP
jgi:hypothetical protein